MADSLLAIFSGQLAASVGIRGGISGWKDRRGRVRSTGAQERMGERMQLRRGREKREEMIQRQKSRQENDGR